MSKLIHRTCWFYDNGRWTYIRAKKKNPALCAVLFCRNPKPKDQNKICNACRLKRWRANNPVRRIYQIIKDRAKRRNQLFTIEFGDLLNLIQNAGTRYDGSIYHIDRIDPLRGYEPNNIQLLFAHDNLKKSALDKIIHHLDDDPF